MLSFYSYYVFKKIHLGTSVVNVSAIDLDISPNNLIIYSLLVSAEGRFRIESDTGLISVNTATEILDFEISKSHTLIVQSSDGNLVDTAFVFIPIGDVNDNDPVFFENSYSIQVLETVSIGTTILAVQVSILFNLDYVFVFSCLSGIVWRDDESQIYEIM